MRRLFLLPQISSVQARRRRLGITQAQLAKAAHTSQSFIAKLETQKLDPAYSIATKVFSALDGLEATSGAVAGDIMTPKVHSVRPSEKVGAAVAILRKNDISQMPVMENGKAIGSITERWMLELLSNENYAKVSARIVGDTMDDPFPCVSTKTPVAAVVGLLKYAPAVLVMRGQDVAGIIAKSDLLKATK
ncbi:MAG: CBS domain-containing protein [Candidatus Micrarchaeia archaeon]